MHDQTTMLTYVTNYMHMIITMHAAGNTS